MEKIIKDQSKWYETYIFKLSIFKLCDFIRLIDLKNSSQIMENCAIVKIIYFYKSYSFLDSSEINLRQKTGKIFLKWTDIIVRPFL